MALRVVHDGDPTEVARQALAVGKSGRPTRTIGNVLTVLSLDCRWLDVLAFDAFTETPILQKQPPQRRHDAVAVAVGSPWSPQDATRTAAWLESEYEIAVSSAIVTEAVLALSQQRCVHPIRTYLDGLAWDNVARVDRFFTTHCRVPDSAYSRGVARMLFVSAIARVRKPGAKVDTIVVFEGPQGLGKSRLLSSLAFPWFADTPISLGDKDAYQSLRGVWLYELAEMASVKGRDAARIKSFASSPSDHYRPSYEPRARSVPRQCVFVGTTNEREYLVDATGARRFWPIHLEHIDLDGVARDRDQLWAEGDALYRSGATWWPDATLDRLGADATEERYEGDPWEAPLTEWLAKPTMLEMFSEGRSSREPLDPTAGFTMAEILKGAIGIPAERQSKREQERAAVILRRVGWCRDKNPRTVGDRRVRLWFKACAGVVQGGGAEGGAP